MTEESKPEYKHKKRGRPSRKDIKNLQYAKALLESKTAKEAYLKTHPGASDLSANKNAWRMITPEIVGEVRRVLKLEKIAVASKEGLEQMLFFVIARWLKGKESTQNYLRAIELLSKLVPEFMDRTQLNDLSKKSEKEIDDEIRKLGFNPDSI